eukprot:1161407-Pyramimonas_sp.AAC.1
MNTTRRSRAKTETLILANGMESQDREERGDEILGHMKAKVEDPEARGATLRELQQLRVLCSGRGSSEVFSMSLLLRARAK